MSEKQQQFLDANSFFVCYGGAKGGGKSHVIRLKSVGMCLNYPGIRVLMIRCHYPELEENLVRPILRWLPPEILTGGVFYYSRRRFDRLLDIVTSLLTTTAKMADDIVYMQKDIDNIYAGMADIDEKIKNVAGIASGGIENAESNVRNIAEANSRYDGLLAEINGKVDRLETRLNELPVDALTNANDAEKLWNDGLQNIINYGQDIAKLNKEGIKRG